MPLFDRELPDTEINTTLDGAWDLNIIYRERYLGTSSNVIVRLLLATTWSQAQWLDAVELLLVRHPYLRSKLVCEHDNYYLRAVHFPIVEFLQSEGMDLEAKMTKLSQLCHFRFRFRRGPLAKIFVVNNGGETLIEFGISHLIGDGASLLAMASDLLHYLQGGEKPKPASRLPFTAELLGEQHASEQIAAPATGALGQTEPYFPELDFFHSSIAAIALQNIKSVLREKKLSAGITDVFYWAFVKALLDRNLPVPPLAVIQNYRHLFVDDCLKQSTGNFAQYSQIALPDCDPSAMPYDWMEAFSKTRKSLTTTRRILQQNTFVQQINSLFSENYSLEESRTILNNFIGGSQFAINNYGKAFNLDDNIQSLIIDVDIQDEAKLQEMRLITVGNKLFFNLAIDKSLNVNSKEVIHHIFSEVKALKI